MVKSRTTRAETVFPVGRLHRHLKQGQFSERVGIGAPIVMASVLDYLVKTILTSSGNKCIIEGRPRIIPRHIMSAIKNDEELSRLLNETIEFNSMKSFIPEDYLDELYGETDSEDSE